MDYCPNRDEVTAMLLSLLPRGKAWQSEDGSISVADSMLKSFWYAIAGPWTDLETAICNQYEELFAATADVDLDLWYEDYGIPDESDPFGTDLVVRVAATGGTSEAYYQELALALGWSASMHWIKGESTLEILVDLSTSTSFIGVITVGSNWVIGVTPLGIHGFDRLISAFDKIVPAHCVINWATTSSIPLPDEISDEAWLVLFG